MKKIFIAFLILLFVCTMTACGDDIADDTGDTEETPEAALPENLVMLNAREWPENHYTDDIPQPKSGTLVRGWIDPNNDYCYIELSDITQARSEQYIQALQEAGFTKTEEISEEISSEYVSVGTVLARNDTFLSVSFTDDLFCMYIKKEQQ